MKTIKILTLGMFLSLSFVCFSCSSASEELVEQTDEIVRQREPKPRYNNPGWWDSHQGPLWGPYEYQTSYQEHPYSSNTVDTCQNYISFVYSWRSSYDAMFYNRLQLQYRRLPDEYYQTDADLNNIKESEWYNIGDEYPKGRYPGGIIQSKHELDIDALHFPKGKIGFRYRLLHVDYPGVSYGGDTVYNKFLATEWTVLRRFHDSNNSNNPGGFTISDLFIHVSFPIDGASYYCSVFIDNEPIYKIEGNAYICAQKRERGTYKVSVMRYAMGDLESGYRSGSKEGTYDKNSKHIYINFSKNDFAYPSEQ